MDPIKARRHGPTPPPEHLNLTHDPHIGDNGRQVELQIDQKITNKEEVIITVSTSTRLENNKTSVCASPKSPLMKDQDKLDEVSPKKWVIYDMERLGFEEEQIQESIEFMKHLPKDLTKEDLMSQVVEHFAERVMSLDEAIAKLEKEKAQEEVRSREAVIIEVGKEESEMVKRSNGEKGGIERLVLCSVCFNELSNEEVKPLLKCSHGFCRGCYSMYLEQCVKGNKVLDIVCPYVRCEEKFEETQIIGLLNKEQGERYIRLKNIAILNMNPKLRWCIRPGCEKYVIGNGKDRRLVCECKAQICFNCGNRYHEGKSCGTAVDKVYKKYVRDKHVRHCPQCKSGVEKNGGCDHMTCTRCTYQWCWLCDEKYTYDHYEMDNPNHCVKMKKKQGTETPARTERITYWTGICKEPIKLIVFPLFLAIVSVMLPQYVYGVLRNKGKARKDDIIVTSDSGKIVLLFTILGVLFLPISATYIIICVLLDAVVDLWIWLYKVIARKDVTSKCPGPFVPLIV